MALAGGTRLGPYEIVAPLGTGGMGEVYKARDTRLGRDVAVKILPRVFTADPRQRERFLLEARAIAALNHPHICTLHDVGEAGAMDFLVMEYVEGKTLDQHDDRRLPIDRVVAIVLELADALDTAHAKGIVHRDLKPHNIIITPRGRVKLLDFGVAKLVAGSDLRGLAQMPTSTGVLIGTPAYMSPEQLVGDAVGPTSDVFSLGVIAYELATGRHPFATSRSNMQALARALLTETPVPPQEIANGVPVALGDIILRMLAKDPDQRPRAAEVHHALEHPVDGGDSRTTRADTPRRIIVLPFKVLRPDPDTDFLAFSLPDALAASLANLESVVVRSSLTAGRLAANADLRAIQQEADVDIVLSGTVIRAGDLIRVSAQLSDTRGGTLMWSHTLQAPVGDLFGLQDSCVQQIIESLALPLTTRERRLLAHDAPANPLAYELFLRGNQALSGDRMWFDSHARAIALDLYARSIEADAGFAPAWAALGRLHRVAAKYEFEPGGESRTRAEAALSRALELNPDLPSAQLLYAQLDLDRGRGVEAMSRLLDRARRRPNDVEAFVALCQVGRYCGLLDVSIAAHERAILLDSKNRTSSGPHTYFALGDYGRVVDLLKRMWGGYAYIGLVAMWRLGRTTEALDATRRTEQTTSVGRSRAMVGSLRALMEGRHDESAALSRTAVEGSYDVEMTLYIARQLAFIGQREASLNLIDKAIGGGYFCAFQLEHDDWFASIRDDARFEDLLGRARHGREAAAAAFAADGGPGILGRARRDE